MKPRAKARAVLLFLIPGASIVLGVSWLVEGAPNVALAASVGIIMSLGYWLGMTKGWQSAREDVVKSATVELLKKDPLETADERFGRVTAISDLMRALGLSEDMGDQVSSVLGVKPCNDATE